MNQPRIEKLRILQSRLNTARPSNDPEEEFSSYTICMTILDVLDEILDMALRQEL